MCLLSCLYGRFTWLFHFSTKKNTMRYLLYIILSVLYVSVALGAYPYASNPLNFTLCYNYDEGSGQAGELCTSETFNGTLTGNAAWNVTGKFDGGVSHGEPDSFVVQDTINPVLVNTETITLSLWFKLQDLEPNLYRAFLEFRGVKSSQFNVHSIDPGSYLRLGIWQGISGSSYRYWTSVTPITSSTDWQHMFIYHVLGDEASTRVVINNTNITGSWSGDGLSGPYGDNTHIYVGTNNQVGSPRSHLDDVLIGLNLTAPTEEMIEDLYLDTFDAEPEPDVNVTDKALSVMTEYSVFPVIDLSNVTALLSGDTETCETCSHNNLLFLQGGSIGEYYHINQSEYNYLTANLYDFLTGATSDSNETARFQNLTAFDCPSGNYSYAVQENGTLLCRDDIDTDTDTDTTCEDGVCSLGDDIDYKFSSLNFSGTTGFDDLFDNDTTYFSVVDNVITNQTTAGVNISGNYTGDFIHANLTWDRLYSYPVACPGGSAITQLDDTITCSASWLLLSGGMLTGNLDMGGNDIDNVTTLNVTTIQSTTSVNITYNYGNITLDINHIKINFNGTYLIVNNTGIFGGS